MPISWWSHSWSQRKTNGRKSQNHLLPIVNSYIVVEPNTDSQSNFKHHIVAPFSKNARKEHIKATFLVRRPVQEGRAVKWTNRNRNFCVLETFWKVVTGSRKVLTAISLKMSSIQRLGSWQDTKPFYRKADTTHGTSKVALFEERKELARQTERRSETELDWSQKELFWIMW